MIFTIASFKGGQGKTTTAVHLAALLNKRKPTLLIDGDPNNSATSWDRRLGLGFKVVENGQGVRYAKNYDHIVIDTQARPSEDDMRALAGGCDLLIIPITPDAMSLDTLYLLTDTLRKNPDRAPFKILISIVPPKPARDGEEMMATLIEAQLPVFKTVIRRYKAFQKAALEGVLVNEVQDPYALEAWEDYVKVCNELPNI